jgi:hypothetical protein
MSNLEIAICVLILTLAISIMFNFMYRDAFLNYQKWYNAEFKERFKEHQRYNELFDKWYNIANNYEKTLNEYKNNEKK